MPANPSPPARKWILVVDDNARLRDLWINALERAGYAAIGSQDGLAAAELIRDLFPDLIILDLRMPRTSGWDFLEIIRAHPRWQKLPVLIVSGFLEDRGPIAERGLNIVGRMAKPVTINELLEKVRAVTGPGTSSGKSSSPRAGA